jgi:hypothetical protein
MSDQIDQSLLQIKKLLSKFMNFDYILKETQSIFQIFLLETRSIVLHHLSTQKPPDLFQVNLFVFWFFI